MFCFAFDYKFSSLGVVRVREVNIFSAVWRQSFRKTALAIVEDLLQLLFLVFRLFESLLFFPFFFGLFLLLFVFVKFGFDSEFVLQQDELVDQVILLLKKEVFDPVYLFEIGGNPDGGKLFRLLQHLRINVVCGHKYLVVLFLYFRHKFFLDESFCRELFKIRGRSPNLPYNR